MVKIYSWAAVDPTSHFKMADGVGGRYDAPVMLSYSKFYTTSYVQPAVPLPNLTHSSGQGRATTSPQRMQLCLDA